MSFRQQLSKLAGLLGGRGAAERDLGEEIREHLELETQENIAAGMPPEEARRAAFLKFGSVTLAAEDSRAAWRFVTLDSLLQDLRYSARMLKKYPGFTVVAVLTLALGIAANTAIFSLIDALFLRPLPYQDPERLVTVWAKDPSSGDQTHASGLEFLAWKDESHAFAQAAVYTHSRRLNLAMGTSSERVRAASMGADLLPTLGLQPSLGRNFLAAESKTGGNHAVLLTHANWKSRFGADPALLGKTLILNGEGYQVVGVLPAGFELPYVEDFDLVTPVALDSAQMADRQAREFHVVGRLQRGVSRAAAQIDLDRIAQRLALNFPDPKGKWGVRVGPLKDESTELRTTLLTLLGAVGFVLLIACGNVANLLLARALARRKEFAVRALLGAGRLRIIRHLLVESLLLALMACVLGVLLALWGTDSLLTLGARILPHIDHVSMNGRVLSFALGISVLTTLLFGLLPALQSTRIDLNLALKAGGGATSGFAHRRLRSLLVVAEVALALVVLTGAGLLIRSLLGMMNFDLGFRPDNLFTLEVSLEGPRYKSPVQFTNFYQELLSRTAAIPGVEAASVSTNLPAGDSPNLLAKFSVPGRPAPANEPFSVVRAVTPDYFRAAGMTLREGRGLSPQDNAVSTRVAIANESFARRFFPGESPVGREITILPAGANREDGLPAGPVEIVGVVGDVKHWMLGGMPHQDNELYIPYVQRPLPAAFLVVRASTRATALAAGLRGAFHGLDQDLPFPDPQAFRRQLLELAAAQRFFPVLLSIFGGIALILASLGIHGVISHSVSERVHEIGVRMALGARSRDVLQLVVGQGLVLGGIGVGIGLLAALGLTRLIANLLFGVKPADPLTFTVVACLMIGVATLASFVPARRATRVDPMVALRHE